MKKLKTILIIFLVLTSMLFILAGCTTESSAGSESQFVYISDEGNFDIVYHKKTKVMYSASDSIHSYGILTLLVDAEGKPLLYEEE